MRISDGPGMYMCTRLNPFISLRSVTGVVVDIELGSLVAQYCT